MSLAYKLWKIGSILNKEDMQHCIQEKITKEFNPNFVGIDFQFENKEIVSISLNQESLPEDSFYFTKKIGGSGSGIYYLYPNLIVQNEQLEKKVTQLLNTLSNLCLYNASDENKLYIEVVLKCFAVKDYYSQKNKLENELKKKNDIKNEKRLKELTQVISDCSLNKNIINLLTDIVAKICTYKKDNYILYFSINGKTYYELMPEILENWFDTPVIKNKDAATGYDSFLNIETEIGYRPEIKIFSYDQYHDSHNYRINENLPLSKESAKYIKFAWIYILNKLVFNYKGLEYIILPNILIEDQEVYRTVLYRLTSAKKNANEKKITLQTLSLKERNLSKDLENLKKKKDNASKRRAEELNAEFSKIENEIKEADIGMIKEFNEQVDELGDLKDAVTLDFIFTSINKTDLSFEIKGTIEDVVPSRINNIVSNMRYYEIDDLIKIKRGSYDGTFLQDFFNRDELYFKLNRSQSSNKNKIFEERLSLARLLLTDQKIDLNNLFMRFDFNREYNYNHTKRVDKQGVKEWIAFPDQFVSKENNIFKFLKSLNKIKE